MIYFVENQKVGLNTIRKTVFVFFILAIFEIIMIWNKNNGPIIYQGLFLSIALPIMLYFLFIFIELKVCIKKEGIYIRFLPFFMRNKFYPWSEIENVYIRKYKPYKEFGGRGYLLNFFGKGISYTIKGNMGLQIVFKNGQKLLIGTQRPGDLGYIIRVLKNTGVINGLKLTLVEPSLN